MGVEICPFSLLRPWAYITTCIAVQAVITYADGSSGGYGFQRRFLCLSVFFRIISQKTDAVESPNLTHKCSASPWCLEIHLFLGQRSKVKVTRHKSSAGVGICTLWVLASSSLELRLVMMFKVTFLFSLLMARLHIIGGPVCRRLSSIVCNMAHMQRNSPWGQHAATRPVVLRSVGTTPCLIIIHFCPDRTTSRREGVTLYFVLQSGILSSIHQF